MTSPISASLAPDPLAVLRAVARVDLSLAITLGQSLGWSVSEDLAELHARGYVREVFSSRQDGTPGHLHTITDQGREALRRQDAQSSSAPAPTTGRRPPLHRETYNGSELRPFTGRAGSMDALKYPSRVGSQRRYPEHDGSKPPHEDVPPPRKT